jgi:hypothetical protein
LWLCRSGQSSTGRFGVVFARFGREISWSLGVVAGNTVVLGEPRCSQIGQHT